MKRVELIGPSGVGKSTIYKKLEKIPAQNRSYHTISEASKIAALNCIIPKRKIKYRLYQLLLKSSIFKIKERGLSHVILSDAVKGLNKKKDIYKPYNTSFNVLYNSMKDGINPNFRIFTLRKYLESIDKYIMLKSFYTYNKCVILEESLLHWLSTINFNEIEGQYMDDLINDEAYNLSGVIYCKQDPDIIYNQVMQRQAEGFKRINFDTLSDDEVEEEIKSSIKKNNIQIEIYESLGIPILQINTGSDFGLIRNQIQNFIKLLD